MLSRDVGTNTASLELVKILLNSVLSRKGTRFSTIDLIFFYLDTPMLDPVISHGIVAGNISRYMLQFAKSPIADVRFNLKAKLDL